MICEYCIGAFFKKDSWKRREKRHHEQVAEWQESIKQCTICSSLLGSIKDTLLKNMESNISNTLDSYLRFEAVLNAGVLGLLKNALPIYNVTLQESAAREQYVLIFHPVEENILKIDSSGPFGNVEGLVLPVRKFQVYSTSYDERTLPRLSNETSLNLETNLRNKRTLDQIETWLRSCNGEHKHCEHFAKRSDATSMEEGKIDKSSFIPTRLIEVGSAGEDHVRLVETGGKHEFRCYATLSHCWGGFVTVCTYTSNYKEHKKSIPLTSNFPRNFSDAIELCRVLKIRYIWIDSICIIQGGELADFAHEAPRMHEVYGSSYLNIAATSARNSTEGLHRKRRINLLSPSIVPCDWQGRPRHFKVIREDFWSGELLSEPLYKRAWVAQERMLAPRTLNFGSKQLFWQCLTIAACETMPERIPKLIRSAGQEELQWRRLLQQSREDKGRRSSSEHDASSRAPGEVSIDDQIELQEVWRDAVKNYTSCNITNTADKLPAIAGLAQVMHDCCQEEYVAGLWGKEQNLVLQLGWRVKDCKNVDGKPARRQRKDEYRAPTWAWPSVVDGVIEVPRRVKFIRDTPDLEITGKHLVYAHQQETIGWNFMGLNGGWLDVTGSLYTIQMYDARDPEMSHWCWELSDVAEEERPWVYMFPDEPFSSYAGQKKDAPTDAKTDSANLTASEFTILPLFHATDYLETGDYSYYSGRALVVREETDRTRYKYTPEETSAAMFTRMGLVEFRKVREDRWTRFTGKPYKLKSGDDRQRDGDDKIKMFLL